MQNTMDNYRFDRIERDTQEVQRELRRRFNHLENCFQHFEDRFNAVQRRALQSSQWLMGITLVSCMAYVLARLHRI
jgi:hypothetical protein